MGEKAVLIDAAVPLHAVGGSVRERTLARAFLDRLVVDGHRMYASAEMIQEFAFHRLRRGGDRGRAVQETKDVMSLMTVLNVDREVLDLSLDLVERIGVRGRDAVHAATALVYGIPVIASPDPAFDGIPGLRRLDPLRAPR